MKSQTERYCQYIQNAGGQVTIEQFVEDWAPVGEKVITALKEMGIIFEVNNVLKLTDLGEELL